MTDKAEQKQWREVADGLSCVPVEGGWIYKLHASGAICFVPGSEAERDAFRDLQARFARLRAAPREEE